MEEIMTTLNIVKYARNRRFYCHTLHRYTTLTEIGDWWDEGRSFTLRQRVTGADLKAASLLRLLAQRVESGLLEVTEGQLRELVKP
jgi:polyhydroxyalkanoate synthesis regulator protein